MLTGCPNNLLLLGRGITVLLGSAVVIPLQLRLGREREGRGALREHIQQEHRVLLWIEVQMGCRMGNLE